MDKYGININDVVNGIFLGYLCLYNIMYRVGFYEIVNICLILVVNNMIFLNYGRKVIRSVLRKEICKIGREILK